MAAMWNFYKNLLRENVVWLRRASLWAGLCFLLGIFAYTSHPELLPKFQELLKQIFKNVLGEQELRLNFQSALLIFKNNLMVSVLVLFLGVALGLLPLFSLAVNFFLFGFLLAALAGRSAGSGIVLFVAAVGPHGLLEIPAFFLAAAFGLRLGWFWTRPDKNLGIWKNLLQSLKQNLQILPALIILLFVAALVEIFVTGNLVTWLTQ